MDAIRVFRRAAVSDYHRNDAASGHQWGEAIFAARMKVLSDIALSFITGGTTPLLICHRLR